MDLKSFRRRQSPSRSTQAVIEFSGFTKRGFNAMRFTDVLATFLIILPVLFLLFIFSRHESYDQQSNGFAEARIIQENATTSIGSTEFSRDNDMSEDKLLGGLLTTNFDQNLCLSRFQSVSYRRILSHKPSSYLLSKLRTYEELHKRCGPHTPSYTKALELLKSGHNVDSSNCRYIVWMSFSGLGNRIISIASVFLYALLTSRVLLIDGGEQISDLFCQPFPETSWLLPLDFPMTNQFESFSQNSGHCYGNMLKKNMVDSSSPSHIYLHLSHDYDDYDKMFFCQEDQVFLEKVPWLFMRTNNYFVPSLFLIPSFEGELSKLFPEKGTVFHHLGRYLFHPTNHVWGLITRYYQAYLTNADERLGLQIRVYDEQSGVSPHVMRQISACTEQETLLPKVVSGEEGSTIAASKNSKHKAVLVASLSTGYFDFLKNKYWENPTVTGEVVGVYQPSHEGHQQTEKLMHNRKAWAEMYLLSLCDSLVTSAWSTFGYVAQGLGGTKPWILYKAENETTPDPPCGRAMSMEPCFHAPPYYDCKAKAGVDTGNLVPFVKHCEDISWGLQVVDE